MKKLFYHLTVLALCLLILQCEEKSLNPKLEKSTCLLKKIILDGKDYITIEYNNQGIISQVSRKDFAKNNTYLYITKSDTKGRLAEIKEYTNGSLSPDYRVIYAYNKDGKVTRAEGIKITDKGQNTDGIYTFEYDEKGKLAKLNYFFRNGIDTRDYARYEYDSNGNVKYVFLKNFDAAKEQVTVSYISDPPSPLNFDLTKSNPRYLDDFAMYFLFNGEVSDFLNKNQVMKRFNNGYLETYIINESNEQGFPTKITQTTIIGSVAIQKAMNYEYICK